MPRALPTPSHPGPGPGRWARPRVLLAGTADKGIAAPLGGPQGSVNTVLRRLRRAKQDVKQIVALVGEAEQARPGL